MSLSHTAQDRRLRQAKRHRIEDAYGFEQWVKAPKEAMDEFLSYMRDRAGVAR